MYRRSRILLAVAVTTLALTCSAKAYEIERIWPLEESCRVAQYMGGWFQAHFDIAWDWPAEWRTIEWYKDGVLIFTQTVPSGKATHDTTAVLTWDQPGSREVRVRAKYGLLKWESYTGFLIWNVTVFEHRPSVSPVSPDSLVMLDQGATQIFKVQAEDEVEHLKGVKWYLDGVLQGDFPLSGKTAQPEWSHTFDQLGDHLVEAAVYDPFYESVKVAWTVTVEGEPSGTIVSPSSSVTAYAGVPVAFTLAGTDAADDLSLCEVSLDSVFQADASFNGPTSGSTATWSHTFDAPGKYQVAFVPVDSFDNRGTAQVWTITVEANSMQAQVHGMVIGLNAQGQPQGPLAGADVDLAGPGATTTAITDGQGNFEFVGLNPGTYTVNVSKTGYYDAQSPSVPLKAGETRYVTLNLTRELPWPAAFDFSSPYGKHFIEGLPGVLSFSARVAWNGSPGTVRFNVAGTTFPATVTDLGDGQAQASLTIPAPATIPACSQLQVEVENGEGKRTTVYQDVYLHPTPKIQKWFVDALTWKESRAMMPYYITLEASLILWDIVSPVSTKGAVGFREQLTFDPWAGEFSGAIGGFGRVNMTIATSAPVDVLGEARIDLSATQFIVLTGCDEPNVTSGWRGSLSGKAGVGAPVINVIGTVFPAAAPAMTALQKVPIAGDLAKGLKLRVYLLLGGALRGEYKGGIGGCWLGADSVSGSITFGLEGQVAYVLRKWGCNIELGVYAGGTGTPEFQACPAWEFEAVTLRGYTGVFASAWSFRFSSEIGVTLRLPPDERQAVLAIASIPRSELEGGWEPIGDSCLRWGPMNVLAGENSSGGRLRILSVGGEVSEEARLMENVVPLANPAMLSGPSERLILFSLHDPNKAWYAATDIGTVRQTGEQPWTLGRITDDEVAEFSPSAVTAGSGRTLAAWERVSGDTSDANDPGQIAPHLEIVAAWLDPNAGIWGTPQQLTSNAVTDHQPVPIAWGTMHGVLWIQNEGTAAIGDANAGDRLMLATWSGSAWDEPQTLWSAPKGILDFAFVANGSGEGHVVLAVDEDGDPNTTADCELYLLSTANGVWQTAVQLTRDFVEDAMPALVAPNGVPMCIWNADGTLVYSQLGDWNPRPVYSEYTLANEAPSLDAVTMPGGAAIAYTVQGPNGVDIVASFYDADLDCWSLPRQLTNDEHAETALSLTCDANELVIAYLKTQTLRTEMEIEIEGEMQRVENVPQPGRTDLYVLRHALADDLAVVPESLVVEPANPAPGTAATIQATLESRGDLPLQEVVAVFYDGDPSHGGVRIGERQVIPGTLIAGGKHEVSVSWNVPGKESPHEVFVVVDPCLAVEDRDRSNNTLSARTVLSDLAIETCRSTEISSTVMGVTARIVNTGVIPADAFTVSWRLGAADGEQIGTSTIESLIAGGAYEATFMWDTTGYLDAGQNAQVFAVADSAGVVPESDETNNVHSLAVFHPPVASPEAP